ncbi:MAG: type II toxin-antitoxin system VapC family toxin [candidate division KSB1 bacterium]|nr:type II toxin-antitoxin system VapC family toxin [candidate division KSB1 bacterium]
MNAPLYFLDTSFLCAYFNQADSNHHQARDIYRNLSTNNNFQFIITDYIFDEIVTLLMKRTTKHQAIEYSRLLLDEPVFTLFKINQGIFLKAWELFEKTEDKLWSFTDCTSFIVIQELGIQTALSFDRHFRQFGIRILP